MTKCTPEVKARILTLTSLGFTPKEVSKKLHLDPSTVRRNLARLRIHPDITTTTPHPGHLLQPSSICGFVEIFEKAEGGRGRIEVDSVLSGVGI